MTQPDLNKTTVSDSECKLTRDNMRKYFADCGFDQRVITKENMKRLRNCIARDMRESGLIDGSFVPFKVNSMRHGRYMHLKCKSRYFESRQCITFEEHGWIGFAGWADDSNIQPILSGFKFWVDTLPSPVPSDITPN